MVSASWIRARSRGKQPCGEVRGPDEPLGRLSRSWPRTFLRATLSVALALAVGSDARAQSSGTKGFVVRADDDSVQGADGFRAQNKYALIVGIDEYDNKAQGISTLRFAVRDAASVYETLIDPNKGAFRRENVILLTTQSGEKPTDSNIGRALSKLGKLATTEDLVLIYFSGHGYEERGRSYLLPQNADLEALDYTALERDTFIRQIDNLLAEKVIVILDACHAGGISRGGKGVGKDAALSEKYYEQFAASQGRALIASCGGGEFSWEDEELGHGVFTGSLVRALSGEADSQPQDGLVSLNEVRRFLEADVTRWAKQRGKTQTPQVNLESYRGDIPIALNSAHLRQQSRIRDERRQLAERLKIGLVKVEGVDPTALGEAMKLLGRIAQGRTPSPAEEQNLLFLQKLVDGSIDAAMYETALAGIAKQESDIPESIRRSLDKLPEDLREVFRLRTVEGLSETEIATRLDISKSEVIELLDRARETLRAERGR